MLKNDCYSFELMLRKNDRISAFLAKSLGIPADSSRSNTTDNCKKRRIQKSSGIRSSQNIDIDSVFRNETGPFEISVIILILLYAYRNGEILSMKIQENQQILFFPKAYYFLIQILSK